MLKSNIFFIKFFNHYVFFGNFYLLMLNFLIIYKIVMNFQSVNLVNEKAYCTFICHIINNKPKNLLIRKNKEINTPKLRRRNTEKNK